MRDKDRELVAAAAEKISANMALIMVLANADDRFAQVLECVIPGGAEPDEWANLALWVRDPTNWEDEEEPMRASLWPEDYPGRLP